MIHSYTESYRQLPSNTSSSTRYIYRMNAIVEKCEGAGLRKKGSNMLFCQVPSSKTLLCLSFCHPDSNWAYFICIKNALYTVYISEKTHLKDKTRRNKMLELNKTVLLHEKNNTTIQILFTMYLSLHMLSPSSMALEMAAHRVMYPV